MKAINLDGTIKIYGSIPKDWSNVVGGFNTLSSSDLETYGFYDIVIPTITESQELGDIEWDLDNSVFTYPVQSKVFSQSLAEMKAQKIENLKSIYVQELAKTDWIIIRDQELGNTTDSDIASSRAGLRSDCTTHENSINSKTTKAQVADYSLPNFI
jgi:hypothetical protein